MTGKLIMLLGVIVFIVGAWMTWGPKIPWLGHLPGDIYIKGEHTTFYFPIVTCIILSILLTVLLNVLFR